MLRYVIFKSLKSYAISYLKSTRFCKMDSKGKSVYQK